MNTDNTRYGAEKITELLRGAKTLFFVGVGGVNMSSLAAISVSLGFKVYGSDRGASDVTKRLERDGVTVFIGHSAENLRDADALIYTVSIPTDNPEYAEAKKRRIPTISRADYLGWLMSHSKIRIGASGMHGKSTATGMCASIMLAADTNPTISSGAAIHELGCTYRAGGNDIFVYEACEYKDAFLSFYPTIAMILNIDMDHPDYFTDIAMVKDSFRRALSLVSDVAVVNWSDPNVREVCQGVKCRIVKYGTAADEGLMPREEYDLFADEINLHPHCSEFKLYKNGEFLADIRLSEPGLHNIDDAVAASAASLEAGISVENIVRGLENFRGASRRMEHMGKTGSGADIYLDYAHHPTEIKASLASAKAFGGKLVTVFQPHTYTRTKALFSEFADALSLSDEVIIADIFAAREDDVYGINSKMLSDEIKNHGGNSVYSGDIGGENEISDEDEFSRIARYAESRVKNGDNLVIMGAGSIDKVVRMLKLD